MTEPKPRMSWQDKSYYGTLVRVDLWDGGGFTLTLADAVAALSPEQMQTMACAILDMID